MEDIIYDFFAASLQDGYIGELIGIVERFGGAKSLYEICESPNAKEKLCQLGLSGRMAEHMITIRCAADFEREYERMRKNEIKFIRYNDVDYPKKLKNIKSAPYALFVKGSIIKEEIPSVAIIGSRECSEYGRLVAEYFGDRLARNKVNVISGMAIGIDGISQNACVDAGGSSFGVLGCGVDVIYPPSNRKLYGKLTDKAGSSGVISEYAPRTQSCARNFPPRNRIISGLSDVVIVVEARAKSGTLITVDMALEQGKVIMVVPGRITDPLSAGCLRLMKEGALPALCVEDVLEQLDIGVKKKMQNRHNCSLEAKKEDIGLEDDLTKEVYDNLGMDPVSIEEISYRLRKKEDIGKISVAVTKLEMKGLIEEKSQGYFVKCMEFE